ncbi:trehalase isoform X2 [Drosophila sulfurigaster albostrigata]|uniref:trehalase isoform X2 n=1 Tax=Drosophila sulfurigaster albostrigata TaxID=89887 RepID=UPI002D219C96|nr:trehalase isoform X2 [Drosophila sulfurigaster albostrigata]
MSARKCAECGEVHLAGANGAIYCCGTLLRAVQMSNMFKDSKYFVDMVSRYSPDRILADWQLFCSCKKNENSVKHLANFVENHFEPPGTELEAWCPPDWRCEPAFLAQVKDPELKKFASELNKMWKSLGRHIKDCVRSNPLQYSLVYVPNPFIVPGGRFNEFYYWDTYWIVRGLLYNGMAQTARGMIDNLLYIVSQYKFVPNGGRIYYWGRSQPPLLVPMVKSYVEMTNDRKYAVQVLPILEMEIDNFLSNHAVQVKGRTMYQYRDKSNGPRPESFREDVASASGFATNTEKEEHYSHLKAACESGMDFSSRWFVSDCGNNVGTLANIKTTWIVPVDLNCILFRNCKTLAEFNSWMGNTDRAENYRMIAGNLIKAITAVLWNEERGVWFDYDLKNKVPRDYFVATNLSPLWARAYPINNADKITESLMRYIEENKLDSFPGGVPHTLSNTGEQWDYPNVWPPMMHVLIEGLNNLGTPQAKELSQRWRDRWVRSNYEAYKKTGFMYEKYNCEVFGSGGSGEYVNQTGFGWTNGVLIELLAKYGQELTAKDPADAAGCVCPEDDDKSTGKPIVDEECPITSEAYLAQKLEKSQVACAAPINAECNGNGGNTGNNGNTGNAGNAANAQETETGCSVMCCRTVYEEEEEPALIESFATSEQECQCGEEPIKPDPVAKAQTPCPPQTPPQTPCPPKAQPQAQCPPKAQPQAQCPPKAQPQAQCPTSTVNVATATADPRASIAICPVCHEVCDKQEKREKPPIFSLASAAECADPCKASEPKPIEIEMEDVDCLLDLTPSQLEEATAACPCDTEVVNDCGAEAQARSAEDGQDCGECPSVAAECSVGPAPPNPMLRKVFPLADSTTGNCFDAKPQEANNDDDDHCMCCRAKADALAENQKECN